MGKIVMKDYGLILTGREYGKNVAKKIFEAKEPPFILDFSEVLSLGSSFGDEIFKMVLELLDKQVENNVKVVGANKIVNAAILQIAADLKIDLKIE